MSSNALGQGAQRQPSGRKPKPIYRTKSRRRSYTAMRQQHISRHYQNWTERELEEHGRRLANRLLAADEVLLRKFGTPFLSPSARQIVKLLVGAT